MFRNKEEVQLAASNKPNKQDWYKKAGDFDAVLNVPPTLNQELLKSINSTLASIK